MSDKGKNIYFREDSMIQAVVFDMDGVIFDSERLVIKCWEKVAKEKGFTGVEDVCCVCLGTNHAQTKARFLEAYGKDFPYDIYEREMARLFHEKADGGLLPKKKGVDELLTFLKKQGLKIALATSSREVTVRKEIQEAGLLPYFDVIVCGDMIKRSKPEPDIYLKACEYLQVKPENAYAVEDSFNGVRSATRAGLSCIMVPDIKQPDEEMRELACCILPSLLEVKEYLKERLTEK